MNLQVQAAAYALRNFTVGELAAYAGVSPRTAQAILRRNPDAFERVPDEQRRSGGRPAHVWRIRDPESLAADLRALAAASGLSDPERQAATYSPNQLAWDLLMSAEHQLLERRERGDQVGRVEALKATLAATEAVIEQKDRYRSPDGKSAFGTDDELFLRLHLAHQMASRELASGPKRHWYADDEDAAENLQVAVEGLAALVPSLSIEAVSTYWKALSDQAEDIYNMPPVSFVTPPDTDVASIFPELESMHWDHRLDDRLNVLVWTPDWARRFAEVGLVWEIAFGYSSEFSRHYLELTEGGRSAVATAVALTTSGSEWDFRVATESGYSLVLRRWGLASVLNACRSAMLTATTVGWDAWYEPGRLINLNVEHFGGPKSELLRRTEFKRALATTNQRAIGGYKSLRASDEDPSPQLSDGSFSGSIRWYNSDLRFGMVTVNEVDLFFDSNIVSGFEGSPKGEDAVEVETEAAVLRALRPLTPSDDAWAKDNLGAMATGHSETFEGSLDPSASIHRPPSIPVRPRLKRPPKQERQFESTDVAAAERHSADLVHPGEQGSSAWNWMVLHNARLKAALARYISEQRIAEAYRLGAALGRYWWTRDYGAGWDALTPLIEKDCPAELADLRAAVLSWHGRIGMRLEHIDAASRDFVEVHDHSLKTGNRLLEAEALNDLSIWTSWGLAAHRSAEQLSRNAIQIFHRIPGRRSTHGLADSLDNLGTILAKVGDPVQAEAVYFESMSLYESIEDLQLAAWVHIDLARLYLDVGRDADSALHAQHALKVGTRFDDLGMKAYAHQALGRGALQRGEREIAIRRFDEAIEIASRVGNFRLRQEVYGQRSSVTPDNQLAWSNEPEFLGRSLDNDETTRSS